MKEYWTDENGVAHKILYEGGNYIVLDGDDEIYLEDEDVYDEEELEEMRREKEPVYNPNDDLSTYHTLSLWGANGCNW